MSQKSLTDYLFYNHPTIQILADEDGNIRTLNKKAKELKEKLNGKSIEHLVFNQIKSRQVLEGEKTEENWADTVEIGDQLFDLNVHVLPDCYHICLSPSKDNEEYKASMSKLLLQDRIISNSDIIHFEFEYRGKGDVTCNYISKSMLKLYPSLNIDYIRENFVDMMSTVKNSDHELIWDSLERAAEKEELWWVDFKVIIEDGTEIWVEGKARPSRTIDGRLVFIGHFMRIEKRKTIETELHKTKFEYKELFNAIHEGVCVVDQQQKVIAVNPYTYHILGMKKSEVVGKKFSELKPFQTKESNALEIDRHWKESQSHVIAIHNKQKDEIKHVSLDYYSPRDKEDVNHTPCFIMLDDITDIVNYEQELLRSNNVFKLASRAVNEAIWQWDIKNNTLKWGEGMKRLFKYEKPKFPTAQDWQNHIHPDDYNPTKEKFKKALENPETERWSATYRFKNGEGDYIYVNDNAYILRDTSGEAIQVIGSMRDITDTIDTAKEKMTLIGDAIKKERKYISMELHDNLGQYLIALTLYLNRINTEDKELIQKCKELTNEALTQARSLCYKMTPPELSRGFLEAVTELSNNINLTNDITFTVDIDENITQQDFRYIDEYQNFRIIQEFVNNSIKHSDCTKIYCSIQKKNRDIVIRLSDNGKGFELNSISTNGFGIENMYYRAKLANSILIIRSKPGKGTELELKLKNIHFIP